MTLTVLIWTESEEDPGADLVQGMAGGLMICSQQIENLPGAFVCIGRVIIFVDSNRIRTGLIIFVQSTGREWIGKRFGELAIYFGSESGSYPTTVNTFTFSVFIT